MAVRKAFPFYEAGVLFSREANSYLNFFQYYYLHVPTQKSGVANIWVHDENQLLVLINHWNGALPRHWKYWI